MNPGVTEEVGKVTTTFMDILRGQPLSLALVAMNMLLVAFLFYSNAQTLKQRESAVELIVGWQKSTDALMANCVSKEVVEIVVRALERDRELYRQLLPRPPDEQPKLQGDEPKPITLPDPGPFVIPP
jgi:hypothetical protein